MFVIIKIPREYSIHVQHDIDDLLKEGCDRAGLFAFESIYSRYDPKRRYGSKLVPLSVSLLSTRVVPITGHESYFSTYNRITYYDGLVEDISHWLTPEYLASQHRDFAYNIMEDNYRIRKAALPWDIADAFNVHQKASNGLVGYVKRTEDSHFCNPVLNITHSPIAYVASAPIISHLTQPEPNV